MADNKFLNVIIPATTTPLDYTQDVKPSDKFKYDLGAGDLWSRAFKNDSLAVIGANAAINAYEDFNQNPDPKFNFDESLKARPDIQIHEDFLDNFKSRAINKDHFDSLLGYYEEESAKQRYLESKGFWVNFGLGAAAELTNAPLYLGAAVLLPETAAVLSSGRAARFVASGGSGIVLEGIKDVVGEQDKNKLDYAAALLFDGTMGAAFGKNTQKQLLYAQNLLNKEYGLTEEVYAAASKAATRAEKRKIIQDAAEAHSNQKIDKTTLDILDEHVNYSQDSTVKKVWEAMRFDLADTTSKSGSETMQLFSKKLFSDATLQKLDGLDLVGSRDLLEDTMRSRMNVKFYPLMRKYAKIVHDSSGFLGLKTDPEHAAEFSNLIGEIQLNRFLKGISVEDATMAAIKKKNLQPTQELIDLLKESTDMMDANSVQMHRMLKEAGHPDFQDGGIPENPLYSPFHYDKNKFAILQTMGVKSNDIINFFAEAFAKANPGVDPKEANAVAHAFFAMVHDTPTKKQNSFNSIVDDLVQSSSTPQEVKDILNNIKKKGLNKDVAGYTQERINLDYAHTKQIVNDRGEAINIDMTNFLSTDYVNNFDTYIRKTSGATQLTKFNWQNRYGLEGKLSQSEQKALDDGRITQEQANAIIKQRLDEAVAARVAEDPYVKSLKERMDLFAKEKRGWSVDTDIAFKSTLEKITKQLDKRTKAGKEIVKQIEQGNINEALRLVYENIDGIAKLISQDDIKSVMNYVNRANWQTDPNYVKLVEEHTAAVASATQREMANNIKGATRTLKTGQDFEDFLAQVSKELDEKVNAGEMTSTDKGKEIIRLKTILKDMTGVATSKDPNSIYNQLWGVTHAINIARLLGSTFWSMTAELVTTGYDQGFVHLFKELSSLKQLMSAYKNGKIPDGKVAELNDFLGLFNEFLSGPRIFEFDHEFNSAFSKVDGKIGKAIGKVRPFAEKASEFTLLTGGIKPLQAWFQAAHALGIFNKMKKFANTKEKSRFYDSMVKELGLNDDTAEQVYKQIRLYANGEKMNFDKWDPQVRTMFLHGVKRRSDTIIQVNRLGDKPSFVFNPNDEAMLKDTIGGKVFFELKSFLMTSYVKQLGRTLNRGDMYMLGLISTQIAAISLMNIAKAAEENIGNREKRIAAMQPEAIMARTINYVPVTSLIGSTVNIATSLVTGDQLLSNSRHNDLVNDSISSLATIDLLNRVFSIFKLPVNLVKDGVEAKDFSDAASLTGISNHWITKPFYNAMQADGATLK